MLVVFHLLIAAASGLVPSQAPSGSSPAVARVVAAYGDIMEELAVQMAGGGAATPRMKALEAQLEKEVTATSGELLVVMRNGNVEDAEAAAYALRYAPDPDAAVAALLASLDRFEGRLANNIGLALMFLCGRHPSLKVPMPPLVAELHSTDWTHQQKIAQVIDVLVRRGGVVDEDGKLAAALIPMLASQRQRVSDPAREILPATTGVELGKAPEPWVEWYTKRHGRTIDLAAGIYELVQIVRPSMEKGSEVYRVAGRPYATHEALVARLKADRAIAHGLERQFGVVIQVPANGFPQERLTSLAKAVFTEAQPTSLVVSPITDEFVPFAVALRKLRSMLGR
jgi:hypothetical protein